MVWRSFLQIAKTVCTNQLTKVNRQIIELEKTIKSSNVFSMNPIRKMKKFEPEECELIINVNSKGSCTFDIVSTIESLCDDPTTSDVTYHGNSGRRNGNDRQRGLEVMNCSDFVSEEGDGITTVNDDKILRDEMSKGVGLEMLSVAREIPPTHQYVALDCEFVGVEFETRRDISALGRCSIVDYEGNVICDIYAKPVEKITSLRTRWSGITNEHMKMAIPIESALSQISDIIQGKVVIGHDIYSDFRVLGFHHPPHLIRDTQKSKHLLNKLPKVQGSGGSVSLKNMTYSLLDKIIQTGGHCSIQDATASLELYKLVREEWETSLLNDGNQPSRRNDPDQSSSHTDIKTDVNGKSVETEQSWNTDKMAVLSGILSGKVTKKRRKKKKNNGLKAHFGQIINGNKNVLDYFQEKQTVKKPGREQVLAFIQQQKSEGLQSSENVEKTMQIDNPVGKAASTENDATSKVCLRDGKTYPVTKDIKLSMKRKTFETKDKLKSHYAKTVKHLFHDKFWEDHLV